jgi:phage shock protein E
MFILSSLFGFGNRKIKTALARGAVVIDVRTPHEYDQGRVPTSINIPLDRIKPNLERIKNMNAPVVLCCASGMRSASALRLLKQAGLTEVYNGGSWQLVLRLSQS